MNVNNNEFLEHIRNSDKTNAHSFIESVRVNKKSITVKVNNGDYMFNELFSKKSLYNFIIRKLSLFCGVDKDFLEWKYPFKSFNLKK